MRVDLALPKPKGTRTAPRATQTTRRSWQPRRMIIWAQRARTGRVRRLLQGSDRMRYITSTRRTRRGGTGCSAISIEGAEDRAGEDGKERVELREMGRGAYQRRWWRSDG